MNEFEWPEITDKTPIEDVKHIHQRIWDYAIKNGKKPRTPYAYNCAACQYVDIACDKCPIEWHSEDCMVGLYGAWLYAQSFDEAKTYAKLIRNIKWKFERS